MHLSKWPKKKAKKLTIKIKIKKIRKKEGTKRGINQARKKKRNQARRNREGGEEEKSGGGRAAEKEIGRAHV